jgi:hypothetical protein
MFLEVILMKLFFASDIHGSLYYADKMVEAYKASGAEKLILLGDLLYHGPRNDLPRDYKPKEVITLLNSLKSEILAVRGNCEAEVDQMVLEFPVMADYAVLYLDGRMVFITHGHTLNPSNPPMLKEGDILINGHTHIPAQEKVGDFYYINPGSVAIPKQNSDHSYMLYEDGVYTIYSLDSGEAVMQIELR